MKVLIDADACPRNVIRIIRRLRGKFDFELLTIASVNHQFDQCGHITVDAASQATDIALLNRIAAGDLLVTQDYGLAAAALGKKAAVIGPDGRIFEDTTISFLLEERNLKSRLRRGGRRLKGPAPRTGADDQRFEENFSSLLITGGATEI